jgi:hypothetical protein
MNNLAHEICICGHIDWEHKYGHAGKDRHESIVCTKCTCENYKETQKPVYFIN